MHETTKIEPASVEVGLGYTVNMGNFESLRVDISVRDSARSGETVSQLTDRVYAFTERALVTKVNSVREELVGG